jgi:hypothetical protein
VKKAIAILFAFIACAASTAAFAGGRVHFGIGIGFGPYWGPGPFWAPAYYYPPPVYYYPPPPAYYYPPPPPTPIPGPVSSAPAAPASAPAWPPLVVPGDKKSFDDFRADDTDCRGQSVSDASYQQCMYARGHKLAPRSAAPSTR